MIAEIDLEQLDRFHCSLMIDITRIERTNRRQFSHVKVELIFNVIELIVTLPICRKDDDDDDDDDPHVVLDVPHATTR